MVKHMTMEELDAGLEHVRRSPKENGVLEMIVRRPGVGAREVLDRGELDVKQGLIGDTWHLRPGKGRADGTPHPDKQLNIMNVRAVALVAQDRERWALAGDQLFVDFDLSEINVPPGTRLAVGSAIVEVTPPAHLGCSKFVSRFGEDAMNWVNSPTGRDLHLRGINARVVQPGAICRGDVVRKLPVAVETA
jgi:hypothetical protein